MAPATGHGHRILVLTAGFLALGCGDRAGEGSGAEGQAPAVPSLTATPRAPATIPFTATAEDWQILEATATRAWSEGLDTLPIGEAVVEMARWFVGAPYTPKTLDPEGPEQLVVNLREFDCVTLVESVLALTRFTRLAGEEVFVDPDGAHELYRRELAAIRYRGGLFGAYPDRLHYFSEWLYDNDLRGVVRLVTEEIGGVEDAEPIDFMSTHTDAYHQLADPEYVLEIEAIEERLSARPRYFIPQEQIAGDAAGIRSGDVIAATSTVTGLDVAHTGIALWIRDELHLLHAPLVGSVVEISELPLAERIQGISGQDGIMVARPLEVEGAGGGDAEELP